MPSGGLHPKEWQSDWQIDVTMRRAWSTPHGSTARLRVVLCTSGGFYGAPVLRPLRACARLDICAVVRSTHVFSPKAGFLSGALAYDPRSALAYALYLWYRTSASEWLCTVECIETVPTRETASGIQLCTRRAISSAQTGCAFSPRAHPTC